jgi:hypothetical protein
MLSVQEILQLLITYFLLNFTHHQLILIIKSKDSDRWLFLYLQVSKWGGGSTFSVGFGKLSHYQFVGPEI